ncbi:hypothetical protein QVL82_21060, partial [Cellulosimicrobium funkei]|uniref:hypothetical protein n=1 Tax=Cellulosimicrobium funkei TaxID=264251 RepID=UPI003756F194
MVSIIPQPLHVEPGEGHVPVGALEVHAIGLDGAAPWLADLAARVLSGLDGVTATHGDPAAVAVPAADGERTALALR